MDKNIILKDLSNPSDMKILCDYLRELYELITPLYLTSDPDGVVDGRIRDRQALCYVGGNYYISHCVDGETTWMRDPDDLT